MNVPTISWMILLCSALVLYPLAAGAQATETLPGEYQVLPDEPSLHRPGAVLFVEFVDFYCPHCHLFDRTVASTLQKEFGDRLTVHLVGFPVIPGHLSTAFEMYEQAKAMGKGSVMKDALFRMIHQDKIYTFTKGLRALLAKEADLDITLFEAGLASGKPYRLFEDGKAWGERIGLAQTPTVVLDGNLKIENLSIDNFRTVITGILEHDKAR